MNELRLSEDSAYKRIRVARTAQRFPEIFDAVAEGRVTLNAVVLLTPHLTEETAEELLAAAAHQTRSGLELLIARRFPGSESLALVEALPAPLTAGEQLAARPVESPTAAREQLAPGRLAAADAHQARGLGARRRPVHVRE